MVLNILLSGRVAGQLDVDGNGAPRLTYSTTWADTIGAYPLSLSLPITQQIYPETTVSAVLWGLLPDNENLLQRWGSRFHVSPRNPAALLSHVGEDCAGAVQFVSDDRLEDVLSGRDDQIEALDNEELATRLQRLRQDNGMARTVDDVGQFSLAGAQSKIALLRLDDGSWAIPAGRIPTTHILKPPGGDYEGFVENEIFCLRLARAMGLPAAEVEKISIGAETAICVHRYDRVQIQGDLHRVHQEDFCQALGVMPQIQVSEPGRPRASSAGQGAMGPLFATPHRRGNAVSGAGLQLPDRRHRCARKELLPVVRRRRQCATCPAIRHLQRAALPASAEAQDQDGDENRQSLPLVGHPSGRLAGDRNSHAIGPCVGTTNVGCDVPCVAGRRTTGAARNAGRGHRTPRA